MNNFKTIVLLGILSILFLTVGSILGGEDGLWTAMIFAVLLNFVSFFFSDRIALAVNGAKELNPRQYPRAQEIIQRLTRKIQLPMPKLYIINQPQMNAFATGRDPAHASIAMTKGLLETLPDQELEGVLAHELSHVKNRDILIASIAAMIAGAVSYLARFSYLSYGRSRDDNRNSNPIIGILLLFFAPIGAMLIQFAVSREREYEADHDAAQIQGTGRYLATALEDIDGSVKRMPMQTLNPAFHCLYIDNPVGSVPGGLFNLFSTHPPTRERIKRLLAWRS